MKKFIPILTTPFFNGFVKLAEMGANWQQAGSYILHLLLLTIFSFLAVVLRWRDLKFKLK